MSCLLHDSMFGLMVGVLCSSPLFREGTTCATSLLDCSSLHWTEMFSFGSSFLCFPMCPLGPQGANLVNLQQQEKSSRGSSNDALWAQSQSSPPRLPLIDISPSNISLDASVYFSSIVYIAHQSPWLQWPRTLWIWSGWCTVNQDYGFILALDTNIRRSQVVLLEKSRILSTLK